MRVIRGAPDTQIFVRGRGTTGDNSALIIVDGVERGDISKINPNDIESINVLEGCRGGLSTVRVRLTE